VTIAGTQVGRRWLALLMVFALAFTACGDDDDDSGGESSDTTIAGDSTATTTAPEPESESDPEGVISVGYDLVQAGITGVWVDPAAAKNNATANDSLFALVYGRFVTLGPDGELQPDLAESATVVDNNTVEIQLREGVTFSDGSPFDASAVKAGLDRSIASQNEEAYQPEFFSLETVEVTGPTTVKLSFPDGTAPSWFDTFIAAWQTSIVKAGETDFVKPTGAGPMVVESFEEGQSLVLRKNENYWNVDEVKVAGMEFVHIDNAQPQAGLGALRAGQLDVTFTDPSQLTALSGNIESYARISPDQVIWMHMCKRDGPLADARVRTAINKGIDREAINEAIFQGTAEPSTQMFPTGHKFNDPEVDDVLAYDPEGAKELLAEAGFADGITLDVYPIAFGGISETAEVMKQQLEAIGVTLNIKSTGMNYVEDFLKPQAAGIGIYPGNAVGAQKLNAWTGDGLGNVCSFNDPEITQLAADLASVSESTDEAIELWQQAEKKVVNEALGGFVLFRSALAAYDSERLGGLESLQLGQYVVPNPVKTFVKADS
jgi:peptide/nickel transport system substrate-binding protein